MSGLPGAYSLVQSHLKQHKYRETAVSIDGQEHVPAAGAVILAPLHTGYDDPYILLAHSPRQLSFLNRYDRKPEVTEQLREQLRMAATLAIGSVMIDRTESDRDWPPTLVERFGRKPPTREETFQAMTDKLCAGDALCIFPQGTHRDLNNIGRLGTLTARIALETSTPIIPVIIRYDNPQNIGAALITFGEPLNPVVDNTQLNRHHFTEQLHQRLELLSRPA